MKRGIIFHFHTIVITFVLAVLCSSRFGKILTAQGPGGAPMPDFNEMFKNFDFEKFVQELDEQLATIEEEEAATGDKKQTETPRSYGPQPTAGTNKPATAPDNKQEEPIKISDDPAELITNPPLVTTKGNGKAIQMPHKSAERALTNYVQDIINSLHKIDQAALSSHGEEFHEHYLSSCGDNVTDLIVSLSMLISKRAYRVAVLAPPKELEEKLKTYRKNIITVRNTLMRLNNELVVSESDEISEEERMRKRLAELAQVSDLITTPHEPSTARPVSYDAMPKQPATPKPLTNVENLSEKEPLQKESPAINDLDDDDYDDDEALDDEESYDGDGSADLPPLAGRPSTSFHPSPSGAMTDTAGGANPALIQKQFPSVLDDSGILDDYQPAIIPVQSTHIDTGDDDNDYNTPETDNIPAENNDIEEPA